MKPYFRKYRDSRAEWRWTYYASNHEPIGVASEGYRDERDCDRSIELVRSAVDAPVV